MQQEPILLNHIQKFSASSH